MKVHLLELENWVLVLRVMLAVALAVGLGYYWAAVAITIAALISLVVFRWLREWIRRNFARHSETVTFRLAGDADPGDLVSALHELGGVSVRSLQIDRSGDQIEVNVGLKSEAGVRLDRGIS